MILGIGDASDYDTNSATSWSTAKQRGCLWGLVRASTTGVFQSGRPSLRKDSMFELNSSNMKCDEIMRASYAWFDPRINLVNAHDQAIFYLKCIEQAGPGELGPVLDIEDTPSIRSFPGIGGHLLTWLKIVEQSLNIRPRLYTNLDFVSRYLFNSTTKENWLPNYELIVASWSQAAPIVPQPWAPEMWRGWQFRANAPGSYYGFFPLPGKLAPNICLALWRTDV